MYDLSVLYYTANVEDENFEKKIRKNLLKVIGDMPLVSVSQKPLPNFGKNICVGVHDCCYANEFRQIQIGLREVKAPYVITAEADCLYPPEYFQFRPPERGHFYRYSNVWVHYLTESVEESCFFFKGFSDGVQVVDRDLWLNILDETFKNKKPWFSAEDIEQIPRAATNKKYVWSSKNPVISFKTKHNINAHTFTKRGIMPEANLPYWGSAKDLKRRMLREKKAAIRAATHLPFLVRAFEISEGDILEMGTGYFSTLILRWLAEMSGRTLYSYENNRKWYEKAIRKPKDFHKVKFVENWDDADIEKWWGLVFIDHSPAYRRCADIKRVANLADYIVIHDTEPELDGEYHYSKIFPLFKYRQDFTKYKPWTSVVSNFKDVSQWQI